MPKARCLKSDMPKERYAQRAMPKERYAQRAIWPKSDMAKERYGRRAIWPKSDMAKERYGQRAIWPILATPPSRMCICFHMPHASKRLRACSPQVSALTPYMAHMHMRTCTSMLIGCLCPWPSQVSALRTARGWSGLRPHVHVRASQTWLVIGFNGLARGSWAIYVAPGKVDIAVVSGRVALG